MATQDDAAESRLKPKRPTQFITLPRWYHDPQTLSRTLCRLYFIRLPHFHARSEKISGFPLSQLSHHIVHHFWADQSTQLIPATSLTKPILPVSPAPDTEAVTISHQTRAPVPAYLRSRPPTHHLSRTPPPLDQIRRWCQYPSKHESF